MDLTRSSLQVSILVVRAHLRVQGVQQGVASPPCLFWGGGGAGSPKNFKGLVDLEGWPGRLLHGGAEKLTGGRGGEKNTPQSGTCLQSFNVH